jgi:hypothetical protein
MASNAIVMRCRKETISGWNYRAVGFKTSLLSIMLRCANLLFLKSGIWKIHFLILIHELAESANQSISPKFKQYYSYQQNHYFILLFYFIFIFKSYIFVLNHYNLFSRL